MPNATPGYTFDSAIECERLDRQADILDLGRLLDRLQMPPQAHVLDAGCGFGIAARRLAARHPDAEIVGSDLNPSGY